MLCSSLPFVKTDENSSKIISKNTVRNEKTNVRHTNNIQAADEEWVMPVVQVNDSRNYRKEMRQEEV